MPSNMEKKVFPFLSLATSFLGLKMKLCKRRCGQLSGVPKRQAGVKELLLQGFGLHPAGVSSVCLTAFLRSFCGVYRNMLFKIADKHFQGADGVDWQCLGKELWLAPSHPPPHPAPSIRIR